MSDLQDLRHVEALALGALDIAIRAIERLAEERENIPRILTAFRRTGKSEHETQCFAESLHANDTGFAQLLLPQLSGTALGLLILARGRELISPYRPVDEPRRPAPPRPKKTVV